MGIKALSLDGVLILGKNKGHCFDPGETNVERNQESSQTAKATSYQPHITCQEPTLQALKIDSLTSIFTLSSGSLLFELT